VLSQIKFFFDFPDDDGRKFAENSSTDDFHNQSVGGNDYWLIIDRAFIVEITWGRV
jgi:hypothetical protein